MYTLLLKPMNERIGICGLVKREFLTAPDLGFALLSEHVGGGYALEASRRVISYADTELGMERLYAISQLDNERSLRLLARLGFLHEGLCPGESQKSVGLFSRLRPTVKSDPR
jgi:RimJ/RimL family protein N-acetyltransferase